MCGRPLDDAVPLGFHCVDDGGEVPDGIVVWVPDYPLISSVYGEVPLSVVVEGEDSWDTVDTDMLAALPDCLDTLLAAALGHVHAELRDDPAVVGLDGAAARPFAEGAAASLPLHEPDIVFYADGTWLIRFADGEFPVCDPYGLAVVFAGRQPLRVEDLSAV